MISDENDNLFNNKQIGVNAHETIKEMKNDEN